MKNALKKEIQMIEKDKIKFGINYINIIKNKNN